MGVNSLHSFYNNVEHRLFTFFCGFLLADMDVFPVFLKSKTLFSLFQVEFRNNLILEIQDGEWMSYCK